MNLLSIPGLAPEFYGPVVSPANVALGKLRFPDAAVLAHL